MMIENGTVWKKTPVKSGNSAVLTLSKTMRGWLSANEHEGVDNFCERAVIFLKAEKTEEGNCIRIYLEAGK